ncbi:hypothetical protein [Pseudomonas syringae]|uniref:hypothetical protein n=1 Tax=Pseudomonas syringae TaxID=317 RepID=UPI001F36E2D5|nr:hypothetical protein [Pseudomonas syringae]MCF5705205.1 hypothetical protein [Pseudomonas syringae]
MENGAFWKQLTLPIVVLSLLSIVATVAGMLLYSESRGVVFRVWGHDFGTVKNSPDVYGVLQEKMATLESRLSLLEKARQSVVDELPGRGVTKPLNKTRVLDVGQRLDESSLPFSVYVKSANGAEGALNFSIDLQTPESPVYSVRVTKGWSRSFDLGSRSFSFRVVDVDQKLATITVLLKETSE